MEQLQKAARKEFWDEEQKCVVSNGQVSIASQVWMVLADALDPDQAKELMGHIEDYLDRYSMVTPYMHFYYLLALIRVGYKDKAKKHMVEYWGSMLDAGADTFWEMWDPADPTASPYGGSVINSYCHAWSCAPAYLIKKYL